MFIEIVEAFLPALEPPMTDLAHAADQPAINRHILTVLIEAYAASDYGDGPTYAKFQVDEAFAGRLAELQVVLNDYDLSEARINAGPEHWGPSDIEEALRLSSAELVVTANSCWFRDRPKHTDYHVETRAMDIEALLNAFNDGVSELRLGEDIEGMMEFVAEDAKEAELADQLA